MIQTDNSTGIILRPADNSDNSFIRDLSDEAFKLFGDYGDVVLKWFESKYSRTVIALYEERCAGFAMLGRPFDRYDTINSSEILAIAVSPEYRSIGIGTTLLKSIHELAHEARTKMIYLHTATENSHAIKLFSSSGFRVYQVKKYFYPKGQDAFVMTKELNNL